MWNLYCYLLSVICWKCNKNILRKQQYRRTNQDKNIAFWARTIVVELITLQYLLLHMQKMVFLNIQDLIKIERCKAGDEEKKCNNKLSRRIWTNASREFKLNKLFQNTFPITTPNYQQIFRRQRFVQLFISRNRRRYYHLPSPLFISLVDTSSVYLSTAE